MYNVHKRILRTKTSKKYNPSKNVKLVFDKVWFFYFGF